MVTDGQRSPDRFVTTLILKALQDFLHDATDKRETHKRGGGVQFVSWDDWVGRRHRIYNAGRNGA